MIDYEKLQKAWELMRDVLRDNELRQLEQKMKELTKPEPRYKVGQRVWFLESFEGIRESVILDIDSSSDEKYLLRCPEEWAVEEELYPSREALIDAQIAYWKNLKKECEHSELKTECETCLTDPDNVSMGSTCDHEYTFGLGFACVKCGVNVVKDGGADSDCGHESDGKHIGLNDFGTPCEWKCKHCGEFYR